MTANPGSASTPMIEQRVQQFVGSTDSDAESIREYTERLLAVCETQAREVQARLRLALLAAGAFLLFTRQEVTGVSIAGLTINNLALLHSCLPLVVLALVLRSLLTIRDREINVHTYQKIVQHHQPSLFRSGLHDQLVPFETPFARTMSTVVRGTSYGTFFHRVGRGERYVLLAAGPLTFAAYAYLVLLTTYTVRNIAVWLSLLVALGLAALILRASYGPRVFGPTPWDRPPDPPAPTNRTNSPAG